MATPEELAAAEKAKADEAEAAKIAAEAQAKAEAEKLAEEHQNEAFDKERAMNTIKTLREIEKQAKKDAKELEQLKAEEKKRAEAEMTEAQKAQKRAEEAEARAAKLEADAMRRSVADEVGLPATLTDRLKGATREEVLKDAQELLKTLPTLKVAPHIPPTNPEHATQTETEAQKRERLFGHNKNPFDMDAIISGGGGVVWTVPPEEGGKGK